MNVRKTGKILLYIAAGFLGVVLLLMLAVKLALDRVPAYQAEIIDLVHRQTGFHIRFAHVSPSLRWYGPELYFDKLELRSKDDRRVLARAAGGRIAADVWRLIRSGKLLAGRVQLEAPDIMVARLGPDSFALASEIELGRQDTGAAPLSLDDLPAGKFAIRHGRLTVINWNPSLPQLVLNDVNLEVRRDLDTLAVGAEARLPAILGGTLTVAATAQGLADTQTMAWNTIARARDIAFPGWRLLLPDYLSTLNGGTGGFELAAHGVGESLAAANLDFRAKAVSTLLTDGTGAKFDQISGSLDLSHSEDRWTMVGRRVQALQAGRHDPLSEFNISWRGTDLGLLELRARASYLRADSLLPLTGLLPQKDLRERLRDIAPTGEWSDAYLELVRDAAADPWRMQVQATFRGVGYAPFGRAPGFRGITGSIYGNQNGGRVDLDTQGALVAWPGQWPQPVPFDSLSGTIYWKRTTDDLLIASPELKAANRDGSLHLQGFWQQHTGGDSPLLTLVGGIENGNATAAHTYYPRLQMAPSALAWLDRAFTAGHLANAQFVLQGPIRHFPFRDESGLFLVRCSIDGMSLDYQPGWPRIENISAQAEFRNEGLSVRLRSANAGRIKFESGDARFADFKDGELQVHAAAAGDAADALKFLRATPLNAMADQAFSALDATGPLRTRIDLFLPFKQFDRRRVLVQGQVSGATLYRPATALVATELNGDFNLDGAQVVHADVRGRLLGGGFRMLARAPKNKRVTRTQLEFRGTLSGDALRAALDLPPSVAINGLSDWRAVLRMAPAPARERSLRVSGSLAGLELKLPEPLAKPYGRPLPSSLEIQWPADAGPQGRLAIGTVLRGALDMQPDPDGLRLAHAAIVFGTAEPVFSDTQILNLSGKIARLDLAGWQRLRTPDKNARALSYYLHSSKLDIGELDYLGLTFHNVALNLAAVDSRWRLALDGPGMAGSITGPIAADSPEPWDLQFERLQFDDAAPAAPVAGGGAKSADDTNPRGLPALKFHAKDLIWGERHLGDVQATLSKLDDGISLDRLTMTGSSFKVDAQGEWRGKDAGLGRMEGTLTSSDVQATLTQLGYAEVIAGKTGRVDFDLNWLGAPSAESLSDMIGHVQVSVDKGQLLGIKPGAGRVLGLASVAALPRRLALDFSDLTDKGLAFDTIRGDFDLRGGNAYTDNVLLKGPAAEIGLIGRIGLKNKDYDQTAVVTGNIGNSLPIAGALAGGPVIGAAVLVFTQVFKQPLRGLARGYYRITGGWDNPTVERIKSADAAAATAEVPK
jgi:uncharacterized protein (TIGR02099 family)